MVVNLNFRFMYLALSPELTRMGIEEMHLAPVPGHPESMSEKLAKLLDRRHSIPYVEQSFGRPEFLRVHGNDRDGQQDMTDKPCHHFPSVEN